MNKITHLHIIKFLENHGWSFNTSQRPGYLVFLCKLSPSPVIHIKLHYDDDTLRLESIKSIIAELSYSYDMSAPEMERLIIQWYYRVFSQKIKKTREKIK